MDADVCGGEVIVMVLSAGLRGLATQGFAARIPTCLLQGTTAVVLEWIVASTSPLLFLVWKSVSQEVK